MNRKETTKFLSNLLVITRLSGLGKYAASEVTLDYGTKNAKRIDYMQFVPVNTTVSGIEKGSFICYEVKSCKEDVYSGNGLNFFGEQNYIVTTMQCCKDLQPDFLDGTFQKWQKEHHPESEDLCGVIVAVPAGVKPEDEYANPTPLDADCQWTTAVIYPCNFKSYRTRGMTELLFDMLRASMNSGLLRK